MQFLKGIGGAGANKPVTSKTNYFSSLKLEDEKEKSEAKKQNGSKGKKRGPPKGFQPQKFALDFNPPSIILQYRNPQNDKLYHHKMTIKKLSKETSTNEALDYLKKKHYHYFIPKILDEQQIEKLIQKLKNGLIGENKSGIQDVDEDDFQFDYEDDFEV